MPLDVPPPRDSRLGSPLTLSRVHWVQPELPGLKNSRSGRKSVAWVGNKPPCPLPVVCNRLTRPDKLTVPFTLLTTEPGSDVAPIHGRQMVVLEGSDWSGWLEQTGNEADLLRALPAGSLKVEQVR
jgi:hypothetical protein